VTPGNGFLYWANYYLSLSYLEMSTGTATQGGNTSPMNLYAHPGGRFLYAIPSVRWDTSVTPPTTRSFSSFSGCNNLWFSESGDRVYTSCGAVYRTSEGPDDLQPNGSFTAQSNGILWANNSALRQTTAVIPAGQSCCGPIYIEDTEVQLFADDGLLLTQRFPLPPFIGDDGTYLSHGRGVFWNAAADRLYALVEADPSANLTSDNAVVTITPGTSQSCATTITPGAAAYGAGGGSGQINVVTDPNCVWTAATNSNFVYIPTRTGLGSATVNYTVQYNGDAAARTAIINVSGQIFNISQSGFNTPYVSAPSSFTALGGTGSVTVTAPTNTSWTAASNVSWILITQGTGGTGTGYVYFSVSPNSGSTRTGTMTIAGQTVTVVQNGATTQGLSYKPITPCRLMETRPAYNFEGRTGAFGPPFLNAGETRTLLVAQSKTCTIPETAKALFINVTVVPRGSLDYITVYPANTPRPSTWTIRSIGGLIVANSSIVALGHNGGIDVYASNNTDLVIDVSGYFTDDPSVSNLLYYPMSPCRVIDTRSLYRPETGPFGPPSLEALSTRRFRFPESPHCQIPSNAAAYSVTLTVVPSGPLAYLTAWPAGASQPNISSINSPQSRILANSVIIPAGEQGAIDVFAYNKTDLIADINGYFAPDDKVKGLYLFPLTQCRVLNTTDPIFGNALGPPPIPDETARTVPIRTSPCGYAVPQTVKAYAINMTALPNGSPMPFITAWPTGEGRPNASQLNAFEGQIVSNSAIVPSGTNGSIDVFAFRQTHLVLEIGGYFGR
jgi:hypothetical protein